MAKDKDGFYLTYAKSTCEYCACYSNDPEHIATPTSCCYMLSIKLGTDVFTSRNETCRDFYYGRRPHGEVVDE